MIIEYIDGVEVVTHDSGVVSRYTESDLLVLLAEAIQREQDADSDVESIRDRLNNVTKQVAKKLGIVRRIAAIVRRDKYV